MTRGGESLCWVPWWLLRMFDDSKACIVTADSGRRVQALLLLRANALGSTQMQSAAACVMLHKDRQQHQSLDAFQHNTVPLRVSARAR